MNRESYYRGISNLITVLIFALGLSACSTGVVQDGAPSGYVNFSAIPDAVPRVLPKSRYGNPPSYTVEGRTYYVRKTAEGFDERGMASWYGTKFHGQLTSTRNHYNMYSMTAAMLTLPIPSFVQVTNLENGRKVIVEVNDRGPFRRDRIIDLSYAAAGKLGIYPKGTGYVEVRAIDPHTWREGSQQHSAYAENSSSKPSFKSSDHSPLYIQVGAFSDETHAEQLRLTLRREINEPSRIEAALSHGLRIYKVQIGPLSSAYTENQINQRLEQLGYHTMVFL